MFSKHTTKDHHKAAAVRKQYFITAPLCSATTTPTYNVRMCGITIRACLNTPLNTNPRRHHIMCAVTYLPFILPWLRLFVVVFQEIRNFHYDVGRQGVEIYPYITFCLPQCSPNVIYNTCRSIPLVRFMKKVTVCITQVNHIVQQFGGEMKLGDVTNIVMVKILKKKNQPIHS